MYVECDHVFFNVISHYPGVQLVGPKVLRKHFTNYVILLSLRMFVVYELRLKLDAEISSWNLILDQIILIRNQ